MFRNKFIFLVMIFILFAGVVSAYSDLGGGWCGCGSAGGPGTGCPDCTNALNNNTHCTNGTIADGTILDGGLICIDDPANFSNKVFDLNGSSLDATIAGGLIGIKLVNKTNVTIANGTVGSPFGYINYGIYLENVTYADIHNVTVNGTSVVVAPLWYAPGIFLGALAVMDAYTSNSIIYNCTVVNNEVSSPGIYLSYCDGNEIWDTTTSSNGHGIWVRNSWNNQIHDCIADNNVDVLMGATGFACWGSDGYSGNNTFVRVNATSNVYGGMVFWGCSNSTVDYGRFISNAEGIVLSLGAAPRNHNVTVSNNVVDGSTSMGIHVADGAATHVSASLFLNNRITSTTGVAVNFTNTDNNTLINNLVRETSGPTGDAFYFALSADNNTLIENTAHNNTGNGFHVFASEDNTFINSTAYDNYGYGVYLAEADDTFLNHTVLYNNTASDLLIHADGPFDYSGEQFLFFNPYGTYANFTNLSLKDTLVATDEYSVNWTTNSSSLPANLISFENKFVDISLLNGAPAIDTVVWHWLDSELLLGYMEAQFEIWKFTAGAWSDEGATLDLAANTLTIANLNPASDYGILQNLSKCVEITSPGTYTLSADLTGAPISAAPLVGTTCIKIASSDVLFDCGGYSITNNGTVSTTRAISVNQSTNVTVQNCPSLSQYTYGVQTYYTSYSRFTNIIAHNNSARGIYLDDSDHIFLAHSIFHNNSGQILLTNSTYSNLTNNSAYDGSGRGFDLQDAEYSIFRDNTAYDCGTAFYLESDDLTFYNTTAYDSGFGFYFESSARVNSTNATFYGNLVGIFGAISDDIRLRDTHLYNNTLLGDVFLSASAANADLYFTSLIIDNPLGNYENYTNISLYDNMATGDRLVMKWTTNSTELPGGTRSFEQKFVDISTLSTVSIDRISWRWLASEEAGYTPSIFNLMKYNVSDGWTVINNTPDLVGRTLAQYNMDPTSDYGILEFVSNVTIEKTDLSVYPISQGGMVEFQLNITNEGNATLDPVEVIDTLPAGLTYNSSNHTSAPTVLGQVLTWNNVGPILGGDSVIILLNATVDLATTSGFYTNTAEVEAQPSIGPNVTNASSVIVTVNESSIGVNKTMVSGSTGVGSIVTFIIVLNNTGEVDLIPYVNDTLPIQLTYNVGESNPPIDATSGQTLFWNAGGALPAVLAPGDTVTIEYNATITGAGTGIRNDVTATGVPSPSFNGANATNNTFVLFTTWGGGGGGGGGGDDKSLEIEVDEPAYLGESVLITVTSEGNPLNNADVTVRFHNGVSWRFIESQTDSNGETIFIPTHLGTHRASGQKSGYDYDEQYFEVLEPVEGECITDSDCEECYVCEHHEDPADNQCVLEEGAECGVDADCPPKSYYKDPYKEGSDVPFDGDLYYIPEDPDVDEAPEDHMGIQLYACIDCNCEPVECLTDEDCPPGEECTEEYECTDGDEPDIPPECTSDDDCEDNEYCSDGGDCIDLDCVCGYPLNHACVFYECCIDETCWRLYDYNYFCNLELHECEELPSEEDQPLETDIPDEGDVGDPVIIIVTSDGDPVPGADVIIVIDGTPYGMGKTDENGELEFIPEQPGDYLVQVNKEGFASAEDQFVALSGETIWDVIIRGVWIALFILLLIAILYVIASRRKKRRAKDQEE